MSNPAGQLFVVATPIGNLDDISARAMEVLRSVDRIAAEDTRHSGRLLAHLGIDGRMLALHDFNESVVGRKVVAMLEGGEDIALVSDAGTPLISDPGFSLVRLCREQGIDVVPIPGASALTAALSVSGLPTDRFRFEGFPPRRRAARVAWLEAWRDELATVVFYESSHRIADCVEDMRRVIGGDRRAVLARELTKLHESVISGPLAELAVWLEGDPDRRRGEFVVLLAGAAPRSAASGELDATLRVLLDELPLRQAAGLAARLVGCSRNAAYRRALALKA